MRPRGLPSHDRWLGRSGAMTQTAFLVTGTHGSGSELVARCMAALGVRFASAAGECASPQDALTDERLVRLDESILRDGCLAADPGVPDWGWTESEAFDVGAFGRHREEGLSLLGERRSATGCWGMHDPLAAPLLEFWEQLLGPAARFVLVYRAPWFCIAALARLRPEPFRARGGLCGPVVVSLQPASARLSLPPSRPLPAGQRRRGACGPSRVRRTLDRSAAVRFRSCRPRHRSARQGAGVCARRAG